MQELTLQFENVSIMERIVKVLELMRGVTIMPPKATATHKCGLDEALEDVAAGRVYKAKDVDELFKQIFD